tara:strand:- start:17601 stop:18449 length:849 start_codon:yes stop_codon:yes gene_type:complete
MDSAAETIEFNLDECIQEYVKENRPVVSILTPCYGSVCFVNYVYCIMKTKEVFEHYNIPVKIEFCKNDSLVTRARNNLIAKAMSDPDITHFMFIDNDITWDPINIIKLLIANKPISGGVYPLKNYNWEKLANNPDLIKERIEKKNNSRVKNIMDDDLLVQYSLLNYNLNYIGPKIKIEKNLTEVKHVATGFMMIKRAVIEKMSEAFPYTKYTDDVNYLEEHENQYAYALFDCGVEDGHYLSEDWMFCNRWRKLGGKIYVDVSINLSHTGIEQYNGSFLSTLI